MSAREQYPQSGHFPSHQNGNSHRRDRNAIPAVLLVDTSPCGQTARLHFAGDSNVRIAGVSDLARDTDTIAAMAPLDAFRVGRAAHG